MSQIPDGSYKPINDINESILGWEIPVESVPLPSGGVLYSPDSFFYNKASIKVKAMTAKEEDILSSRAYSKEGTTIEHLIASCTGAPLKDVSELLLGDRNALLISIRITGYGSDYSANVTCPKCTKVSENIFDLSELEIIPLDSSLSVADGVFSFKLPVSKKTVYFKFLNNKEEENISKDYENTQKLLGENSVGSITFKLFKRIMKIDDVTDRDKIKKFIDIMPAYDSRSLRKFISDKEPRLKTEINYKCKHCSEESEILLPIGRNFFWPAWKRT